MKASAQTAHSTSSGRPRELLAAALFIAACVVLASRFQMLPLMIHSPFNHGGNSHGLANKNQLWLLLIIGAWIYVLMSFINLLGPDALNTSRPLSPEQRLLWTERVKAAMGWAKAMSMMGLLLWICSYVIR